MEPRVSLCMIVKNEADNLPRCLTSVEGVADEIIVVDTGSRDATAAIAESFGARVYRSTWDGDFAAARNRSLERARSEWILFLDADEELDAGDRSKLRGLMESAADEVMGITVCIVSLNRETGKPESNLASLRVFRNRPEHRFVGRIHEQISCVILEHRPDAVFLPSPVRVYHHGYTSSQVELKGKVKRNLGILRRMSTEEACDSFARYNLGVEYQRCGMLEAAVLELNGAIDAATASAKVTAPFLPVAYLRKAQTLSDLTRYSDSLEALDAAIDLYPRYTDLIYTRAVLLYALGESEEAAVDLYRCLDLGDALGVALATVGFGSFKARVQLATVLGDMGSVAEGLDHCIEALRLVPDCSDAASLLVRLAAAAPPLSSSDDPERAGIDSVRPYLPLLAPMAIGTIAKAYLTSGKGGAALQVLSCVTGLEWRVSDLGCTPDEMAARCLVRGPNMAEGLKMLVKLHESGNLSSDGVTDLCLLLLDIGDCEKALRVAETHDLLSAWAMCVVDQAGAPRGYDMSASMVSPLLRLRKPREAKLEFISDVVHKVGQLRLSGLVKPLLEASAALSMEHSFPELANLGSPGAGASAGADAGVGTGTLAQAEWPVVRNRRPTACEYVSMAN